MLGMKVVFENDVPFLRVFGKKLQKGARVEFKDGDLIVQELGVTSQYGQTIFALNILVRFNETKKMEDVLCDLRAVFFENKKRVLLNKGQLYLSTTMNVFMPKAELATMSGIYGYSGSMSYSGQAGGKFLYSNSAILSVYPLKKKELCVKKTRDLFFLQAGQRVEILSQKWMGDKKTGVIERVHKMSTGKKIYELFGGCFDKKGLKKCKK